MCWIARRMGKGFSSMYPVQGKKYTLRLPDINGKIMLLQENWGHSMTPGSVNHSAPALFPWNPISVVFETEKKSWIWKIFELKTVDGWELSSCLGTLIPNTYYLVLYLIPNTWYQKHWVWPPQKNEEFDIRHISDIIKFVGIISKMKNKLPIDFACWSHWRMLSTVLLKVFRLHLIPLDRTWTSMHLVLNNKSLNAALRCPTTTIQNMLQVFHPSILHEMPTTDDVYLIGTAKTVTAAYPATCRSAHTCLDDSLPMDGYNSIHQSQHHYPSTAASRKRALWCAHQSAMFPLCKTIRILSGMQKISSLLYSAAIGSTPAQPGNIVTPIISFSGWLSVAQQVTCLHGTSQQIFIPLGWNSIAAPSWETVSSPVAHAWMDITGDGVTDDAHSFTIIFCCRPLPSALLLFQRQICLRNAHLYAGRSSVASHDGGSSNYRDCSRTRHVTYGLGLMRKFSSDTKAYGHGGDLTYSASSWYFLDFDISISVSQQWINSQFLGLIPVVTALLQTYLSTGILWTE